MPFIVAILFSTEVLGKSIAELWTTTEHDRKTTFDSQLVLLFDNTEKRQQIDTAIDQNEARRRTSNTTQKKKAMLKMD